MLSAHAGVVPYDDPHGDVYHRVRQIVGVIDKHNLPTCSSGINLLLATGLLGVCATRKDLDKDPVRRRLNVLFWGFLFLSIDEIAGILETVNMAIDPSRAIGAVVIAFLLRIWYIPFFKSLPKRALIGFVEAGALYVGGAVGIEIMVEPARQRLSRLQFVYTRRGGHGAVRRYSAPARPRCTHLLISSGMNP